MTLFTGDCTKVLTAFDEESIDLLATDPPYGIEFMGKDWDKAVPSVEIWKECFRVLKAGSFAFVMSSPRLDVLSEMGRRLKEAGFDIGFTPIYWAYASGFPKAMNVSKAVDKKLGVEREVIGTYQYPTDQPKRRQLQGGGKPYLD
jgi:site-specific DNA-methyltransferase (adenine-specific)